MSFFHLVLVHLLSLGEVMVVGLLSRRTKLPSFVTKLTKSLPSHLKFLLYGHVAIKQPTRAHHHLR